MAKGIFRRVTERFFIFCNLFVAVMFLLGCYASMFDPQRFWFLGLLTLASLYLLFVLVIFIFLWLFAKAKYMLISLLAIGLAWNPLSHLIKLRTPPRFKVAKMTGDLRVKMKRNLR